jgi:hypothetical protein
LLGTLRIVEPLLILTLGLMYLPQDQISTFRSRLEHDPDPVHKARIMKELGDAEFQQIQKDLAAGDDPDAVAVLEKYQAEAQGCVKDLDAKEIDAEKHPNGFKQLQVSIRQSLRRLDDILPSLTADEQKPFLEVRKQLEHLDRHLIRELFPRQPGAESPPAKPKS